ncbi:MAG: hypothetical protein HY812_15165 [Planctomycetes bacterium]|nr:hypothetical protein [Planctomycetota bacterium]
MIAQCESCHAQFDVTGKTPGALFQCPKCKQGRIRVPLEELTLADEIQELPEAAPEELAELEEVVEAPAAKPAPAAAPKAPRAAQGPPRSAGAGAPRFATGRARAPRERERPAGTRLSPAVLGGIAAAVLAIAIGGYFLLRGDGESGGKADKGRAGGSAPAKTAAGAPGQPQNPRALYEERRAALERFDAASRASLAAFCSENRMKVEARDLNREALLLDPWNEQARLALGFQKYEGPAAQYQGRWLNRAEHEFAKAAERFAGGGGLSAAATAADVFLREADATKGGMLREFPEDRWLYAFGADLMPQPFFVVIEKGGDAAKADGYRKEYAEVLGTLYEAFYQRFQELFQLEAITRPIRVVMFDSKRSYAAHREKHPERDYADPTFIGGYYQPQEQRLIMWRQPGLRGVLFHEGTHMFVHYAFSGRGFEPSNESPWFQEGFAEYFGGYKVESKVVDGVKQRTFIVGQFLAERYVQYRDLVQRGRALPIRDLVKVNHLQFNDAKGKQPEQEAVDLIANVYATGWAFIMYLNSAKGGAYRKVFDEYFKRETQGAGHWGSLAELMNIETDQEWTDLNDDFTHWAMNELKP